MASVLQTFARNDFRVITRDSFLFWAAIMPLAAWIPIRFVVPILAEWLQNRFGFDLTAYYPLIVIMMPIVAIQTLLGLLFGLVVLDERDNNTLTALSVTPLSMSRYGLYRLALPFAYALLTTIASLPVIGIMPLSMIPAGIATAIGCSFFSSMVAMLLAGFARNKIEGITIFRAATLFLPAMLIAYFVDSKWQYLFGINPIYWPMKAFWTYWDGQNGTVFILIGLAYGYSLNLVLFRRFRKSLGSGDVRAGSR